MHQAIAEAHHLAEGAGELRGQEVVFVEDIENIAVIFGGAILLSRNDVVADVNASGNGNLQIVFGCAHLGRVRQKSALVNGGKVAQITYICAEVIQHPLNFFGVDHLILVHAHRQKTLAEKIQPPAENQSIPRACAFQTQYGNRHRGHRATGPPSRLPL